MKSFKQWMKDVDEKIEDICGLYSSDLADYSYFEAYESGAGTTEIAKRVLRAEGWTG